MRAAAEDMVRVLIDLRDNLNREGQIFDDSYETIPFGQNNPSGYVYDLRLQARQALQYARANLLLQAGQVKKIVDAVFKATEGYEGADASSDELFQRLSGQLDEIQQGSVRQI